MILNVNIFFITIFLFLGSMITKGDMAENEDNVPDYAGPKNAHFFDVRNVII